MEIAGITLRVLEIITVILCGIRLAVPPGHFRWERLWTKVLYWILVIFWIVFDAGNIYFFKFSSLQEVIVTIGVFILLCIFLILISGSYLYSFLFIIIQSISLDSCMFLHYVMWNMFICKIMLRLRMDLGGTGFRYVEWQ